VDIAQAALDMLHKSAKFSY